MLNPQPVEVHIRTENSNFSLPAPGTQPEHPVLSLVIGNRNEQAEFAVLPLLSGLLYAVRHPTTIAGQVISPGEILAVIDPTDLLGKYVKRYPKGLFSLQRGLREYEINAADYDPRDAMAWLEGRNKVKDAQTLHARKLHDCTSQVLQAVLAYIERLESWTNETQDFEGHYQHAAQLEMLTYQPFVTTFEFLITALHKRHREHVVNYCRLLKLRFELERVMALLSHSLYHVERRGEASASLHKLLPLERRRQIVTDLNEGVEPRLNAILGGLGLEAGELLNGLRRFQDHFMSDPKEAKKHLESIVTRFDHLARFGHRTNA